MWESFQLLGSYAIVRFKHISDMAGSISFSMICINPIFSIAYEHKGHGSYMIHDGAYFRNLFCSQPFLLCFVCNHLRL